MHKKLLTLLAISLFFIISSVNVFASNNVSDGEYSINYQILKATSNEDSMMSDYVEKPGTLTVRDGKRYVSFTLKESSAITSFKTEKNGTLVDTVVVSSDSEKNTRVVEFEVEDMSKPLNAWVSIYMPLPGGAIYDSKYDVRVSVDEASVKAKEANQTNQTDQTTKDEMILYLNKKTAVSNGKSFILLEAPYMKNNRTLVPLRFISENLGANVKWDHTKRTITVLIEDKTLVLTEGSKEVTVNGKNYTIEAAPEIKKGTTFVPLRFISEQLGAQVNWKQADKSITILK